MQEDPIIGIPIDSIPNDLKDWARQQRHNVKLWIVRKFVELNNSKNVVFEFPEEFKPALDTEEENQTPKANKGIAQFEVEIADLISANLLKVSDKLHMSYKPRNGQQKIYDAIILEDGSLELLGQTFSAPSYAALAGIQDAGSDRKTVNGWTSWKSINGQTLANLRDILLNTAPLEN